MVCLMVAPEPLNNIDSAPETATGARPLRIFVALRIAPDIALALAQYGRDLEQYSVRLVAPADIHLTLVPPWNEISLPNTIAKLRRVADKCVAFTLAFRHIGYGPEPRHPRFLWAECVANNDLAEFRAALLRAFGQADERPFRPHVTLARLHDKGRAIARKHPLDQILALTERIESIELMQSPPPGGGGYKVLASVPLGGNRELPSGA
jgi:RNA 2',3'-cyclic 3'-phosphodiesterase